MSAFEDQRRFGAWLESGDGEPVAGVERARVAVHRNTFVGTLVEALAESFPVTRALAGADFFDAMARTRVLAEPPRSPVLTDYALSFPGFVAGVAPAAAAPVLAEMAQLEALRLRAFHAVDAIPAGLADFHRLACDAALFARTCARLHPAAHWFRARHAVLDLWRAHDDAPDMASVDLAGIDATRAQDVLIVRPEFVVRMRPLPPGAIAFLDALASGCRFAEAFVAAAKADPLTEPAVLCSLLLQEGLVTEFIDLPESSP
jgi:hypothetical protein